MTYLAAIVIVGALLLWREHAMQAERREWAKERCLLLNRISPATAQLPPGEPEVETFQPPSFEDDEALQELRKLMG